MTLHYCELISSKVQELRSEDQDTWLYLQQDSLLRNTCCGGKLQSLWSLTKGTLHYNVIHILGGGICIKWGDTLMRYTGFGTCWAWLFKRWDTRTEQAGLLVLRRELTNNRCWCQF